MKIAIIGCGEVGCLYASTLSKAGYTLALCAPRFLDMLLRNHVTHACRQRHKVAEAAEQLKAFGLPVQLLPAIENLFSTTCTSIQTHPLDTKNISTKTALNWLLTTRSLKRI